MAVTPRSAALVPGASARSRSSTSVFAVSSLGPRQAAAAPACHAAVERRLDPRQVAPWASPRRRRAVPPRSRVSVARGTAAGRGRTGSPTSQRARRLADRDSRRRPLVARPAPPGRPRRAGEPVGVAARPPGRPLRPARPRRSTKPAEVGVRVRPGYAPPARAWRRNSGRSLHRAYSTAPRRASVSAVPAPVITSWTPSRVRSVVHVAEVVELARRTRACVDRDRVAARTSARRLVAARELHVLQAAQRQRGRMRTLAVAPARRRRSRLSLITISRDRATRPPSRTGLQLGHDPDAAAALAHLVARRSAPRRWRLSKTLTAWSARTAGRCWRCRTGTRRWRRAAVTAPTRSRGWRRRGSRGEQTSMELLRLAPAAHRSRAVQ